MRTPSRAIFIRLQTICALAALFMGWPHPLAAMTARALTIFCTKNIQTCPDGETPSGQLVQDAAGNLFGTTQTGGVHLSGTVFELRYHPDKDKWQKKVIYNFCALANCVDGAGPSGTLVRDAAGNLYGTTYGGGSTSNGVVFELSPPSHTKWTYKVLWNACSKSGKCEDGAGPVGLTYAGQQDGALYDGESPLFGETVTGRNGIQGVVYSLEPEADHTWTQKVLYRFCSKGGGACTDGKYPNGDLITDGAGDLFGSTNAGGIQDAGLVFKLAPGSKFWNESVLHSFCSEANCADGRTPWFQSMTLDKDGTIYGTTLYGGRQNGNCIAYGAGECGVVYKIAADGTESTLYSFCNLANCADGYQPTTGLFIDNSGLLYGTTVDSSEYQATLFKLTKEGSLQTLYVFSCHSGCKYGRDPSGNPLVDGAGNIFGMMMNYGVKGGQQGRGTVFELSP